MNKNLQLVIGGLVLIAIGSVIYFVPSKNTNTIEEQPTPTKKVKTTPDARKEPQIPTGTTVPQANTPGTSSAAVIKNSPPIQPPKNSSTNYSCKDNKSLSVKYSFTNIASTTLTLVDSNGKRSFFIRPKPSGTDPTFQSENGAIDFVNKGIESLVKENGKVTFENCTFKPE